MDEMEAEDQTAIEIEEYEDSSDDEQYSLPKEWKEYGFGNLMTSRPVFALLHECEPVAYYSHPGL